MRGGVGGYSWCQCEGCSWRRVSRERREIAQIEHQADSALQVLEKKGYKTELAEEVKGDKEVALRTRHDVTRTLGLHGSDLVLTTTTLGLTYEIIPVN